MNIEEILKLVARPGDTILDVGGHVGNVAWFMTSCVGPKGKVFSFEPHPEKFKALHARAERYPTLTAVNAAVSNSSAPVTLYFGADERSDQASTICAELATSSRFQEGTHSVQVAAITLDQFCADQGLRPAIIKIDVEGAEPFVLEGAKDVLKDRPLLIFELGVEKELPGHLDELRQLGYELYFVDMHRYPGPQTAFHDVINTETRALRNCILSFEDSAAAHLAPFLSNVLAVVPEKHGARMTGLRVMALAQALPHFADPGKSWGRRIKRFVRRSFIPPALEERHPGLVVALRNIANRFL